MRFRLVGAVAAAFGVVALAGCANGEATTATISQEQTEQLAAECAAASAGGVLTQAEIVETFAVALTEARPDLGGAEHERLVQECLRAAQP